MKQALISPNEPVQTGYRIAEVVEQEFEIAPPMFWVTCEGDIVVDYFWYDPSDQTIKPIPMPENQPTTTSAETL